jgi:hypothetical protein
MDELWQITFNHSLVGKIAVAVIGVNVINLLVRLPQDLT